MIYIYFNFARRKPRLSWISRWSFCILEFVRYIKESIMCKKKHSFSGLEVSISQNRTKKKKLIIYFLFGWNLQQHGLWPWPWKYMFRCVSKLPTPLKNWILLPFRGESRVTPKQVILSTGREVAQADPGAKSPREAPQGQDRFSKLWGRVGM